MSKNEEQNEVFLVSTFGLDFPLANNPIMCVEYAFIMRRNCQLNDKFREVPSPATGGQLGENWQPNQ